MRLIWAAAGYIALGLGLIGVVLPIMPTVPFLLLAAFCFGRSSKRLHDWMLSNPTYGPQIRAWEESGAIPRKAKLFSIGSMAASVGIGALIGLTPPILAVQATILIAVSIFIWTRPEA